jgi:hypothetical protein
MLEKDIESYLVKRIKAKGGIAYKFVSPQNRGVCDRIVVLPGRVVFVEVKQPKGKLSELQKRFANTIMGYGLGYICLWSKSEIDQWMEQL